MNFHQLGLDKALVRTLEAIGHATPTPIQTQAIPSILQGNDVVGLAQTGTGKTAAFLLPLLQMQNRPDHKGKFRPIRVIVLSPTRELAAQIYDKARQFGKSLNLRSQCAVGGVPVTKQQQFLARGTDILIATPGRLLDLAKRKAISFDQVQALVLDEADHMLDIGFLPDIKRIIAQLPDERQTLLFSATMPKPIRDLASTYLNNPVEVSVARLSSVADNIDQQVIHLSSRQKSDRLAKLIKEHDGKRVVVFARTKNGSDRIVQRLKVHDIEARAIHGNKAQSQRERALKAFARGDCNVLIATDIAARGIDIKDVGLVVNYELPDVPEVYVHRIGRTARAGASGLAVAFCSPDEVKKLRAIEKLIKLTIPPEGDINEPASRKPASPGQKRRPRRSKDARPFGKPVKRRAEHKPSDGNDTVKSREGDQAKRPVKKRVKTSRPKSRRPKRKRPAAAAS